MNSLAARANGDAFNRASSGASARQKPKLGLEEVSAPRGPKYKDTSATGFGRVSSVSSRILSHGLVLSVLQST